jgi:hypothetical protein
MKLVLDPDVEKVMEFMAREIKRHKLVFVAQAVAKLTELAWADVSLASETTNAVLLSDWSGTPIQRLHD